MNSKAIVKVLMLGTCTATICLLTMDSPARLQTTFYQDDATEQIDFGAAISRLKVAWEAGNVQRVEVIHIPSNRIYRKSVSASTIDATYVFKLVVREPRETRVVSDLMRRIGELEASSLGKPADLRWGCVFYSASDTRLLSIYFNANGLEGVVDKACVRFDSTALAQWAEEKFACVSN